MMDDSKKPSFFTPFFYLRPDASRCVFRDLDTEELGEVARQPDEHHHRPSLVDGRERRYDCSVEGGDDSREGKSRRSGSSRRALSVSVRDAICRGRSSSSQGRSASVTGMLRLEHDPEYRVISFDPLKRLLLPTPIGAWPAFSLHDV